MEKPKKILFVCTEDWFFYSHFLPLGRTVARNKRLTPIVLTTANGVHRKLEQRGLKVIPLDFERSSKNPFSAIRLLWELVGVFRAQRPDLIHFIALKPVLLGGVAALFVPKAKTVFHVTGLGFLSEGKSRITAMARFAGFSMLGLYLKRAGSWLICENPDDLEFLARYKAGNTSNSSIFQGAGIDPDKFVQLPALNQSPIKVGYVGRMIWTKGVDVLVQAMKILADKKVAVKLEMYGTPDTGNPKDIRIEELKKWNREPNINWHGHTSDVGKVWKTCAIGVVPTRTREGMPRAMLEAASSGRALVVTDVPGCRHFVRNGIEGFVVPPEDPYALAEAIEKLVNNEQLRSRMGIAARARVLEGYTEHHVEVAALEVYRSLLGLEGDDAGGLNKGAGWQGPTR